MSNLHEYIAGKNPTNAASVLQMLMLTNDAPGAVVTWQSVAGINYFLDRGTNLAAQPPFQTIATNILGQPGATSYEDTNAAGDGPLFYRVGVQ